MQVKTKIIIKGRVKVKDKVHMVEQKIQPVQEQD